MRVSLLILCLLLTACSAVADELDLLALSLEDLLEIEVTLVSRRQERWFDAPAAVHVLTREDLRRCGATSIPEALRLVPGVQVARIDANKWAVSARGFNGRFAQKLLVLIDGRSVYTPLFSGVIWETRDVLLEDVERIEVIRGPGGTLWGANAVNGIINIVTAEAVDSAGGLAVVGAGTEERGFARGRYGGRWGEKADYRVYAKGFARDRLVDAAGRSGADDWQMRQAGFRFDQKRADGELTWQGDLYSGERGQVYRFAALTPPYVDLVEDDTRLSGGNLLGRWTHRRASGAEMKLQFYYDRTRWQDALFTETRGTWDVDFQHIFGRGRRQEIVWGLGYRLTRDRIAGSPFLSVTPKQRGMPLYSAFVQDQVELIAGRLRLVAGSKVEHNAHTGFEYQPGARLLWTPGARHAIWAAVTRAVRTPSRSEDDVQLTIQALPPDALFAGSPPTLPILLGNRELEAERLHAFELGYRTQPRNGLAVDLAGFYNDYEDLRTGTLEAPYRGDLPGDLYLVIPVRAANLVQATTYGLDLAADWRGMGDGWRLRAAYSYLRMDVETGPESNPLAAVQEEEYPAHQLSLWSSADWRNDLELDAMLRYVDRLSGPGIPAYLTLDLRLAWKLGPGLELALSGRNLLDAHHLEYKAELLVDTVPTETQRGVYGTIAWSFGGMR